MKEPIYFSSHSNLKLIYLWKSRVSCSKEKLIPILELLTGALNPTQKINDFNFFFKKKNSSFHNFFTVYKKKNINNNIIFLIFSI